MSLENFSHLRLYVEYSLKSFDCLDADLNDFFHNDSLPYLTQLLSVTYAFEDNDNTIAFYSLQNDKISLTNSFGNEWWKLNIWDTLPEGKRYTTFPAVKIGRLGVHKKYQSLGYGTNILDYIKGSFLDKNKTGCRYITVDAYNNNRTINFYLRNGFQFLTGRDEKKSTRLMFFDLSLYK